MHRSHHQDNACQAASLVTILQQRAALTPERIAYRLHPSDQGPSHQLTYGALDRKARAIGAWLQQQGAMGQRALLLYPFGLEFIAGFYGCLYAGAVAVPLYPPRPNRPDQRLLNIVADAQPTIALTSAKILASLAERQAAATGLEHLQWLATDTLDDTLPASWHPQNPDPAWLAFLQYTSGSTGAPKGVMISHANLLHNAAMIHTAFALSPQSAGLIWTPFYHDMGLIGGVIEPIYAGAPTTLLDPVAFLQQPSRWLRAIAEEHIAVSGGPNFAYELCIDKITPAQCAGLDLSSWTVAFCGAEPVRAATLERFAAKFAPYGFRTEAFTPCLGMAESTVMTTCTPQAQTPVVITCAADALSQHRVELLTKSPITQPSQRLVSSGQSWLEQTVCIVHPEHQTRCGPGDVGEIWIAGPSVAQGYWQRAAETAATFGATLADTGKGPFLRSGDLGFLHDGELFVTGRLKDLIIIRGRNYYPQDLEATAEQAHPALQPSSTAAFSIEADNAEQLVLVAEVMRTHLRTLVVDEVMAAIRSALSQEHQLQVSAIALLRPGRSLKTSSGKIQRSAARQAYRQGTLETLALWSQTLAAAASQPSDSYNTPQPYGRELRSSHTALAIEQWLTMQLAQRLHTDPLRIDLHKPFADYGLDSVAAIELIHELCTWLQNTGRPHTLEVTALWDFPTIAALAHHLAGGSTVNTPAARPLSLSHKPAPVSVTGTLNLPAEAAQQSELATELAQLIRVLSCGCDENRRLRLAAGQETNAGFHTEQSIA